VTRKRGVSYPKPNLLAATAAIKEIFKKHGADFGILIRWLKSLVNTPNQKSIAYEICVVFNPGRTTGRMLNMYERLEQNKTNLKNLRLPAFSQKKTSMAAQGFWFTWCDIWFLYANWAKVVTLFPYTRDTMMERSKTYFTGIFILYWHYHK